MPRAPLVPATALFAAGIAVGLTRSAPSWLGPLALPGSVAAAACCVAMVLGVASLKVGPRAVLALFLVAGWTTGAATLARDRGSCAARLPVDVPLTFHGTLTEEGAAPRVRVSSVAVEGGSAQCVMELGARWPRQASGGAAGWRAGTRVALVARLWRPPGAGVGAAAGLLLVDSARAESQGRGQAGGGVAARIRAAARSRLDALYPRRSGLAASLLLAQRDGLHPDVRERYARAGLSHLLAISGLHVGLIAGVLLLLGGAARLSRPVGSAAAAVGTVAYVAFLGAPHAATRAAVQIVLLLAGRSLQRPAQPVSVITTAALLLLAADPGALLAPGFQLSFAGVAGILVLRRPLLRALQGSARRAAPAWMGQGTKLPRAGRWLADGIATSLAATVATAPVAAWHFGRLAPIGVVANLVAIPLLGVLIPTLALSLLLAAAWHGAGAFIAGAGGALMAALDRVAAAAAGVPWGAFAVSGPGVALLAGAALLGYLVSRRMGRLRPWLRAGAASGVAVVVLVVSPLRPSSGRVELHMIDVGQGDAFALRTPAGRWFLVDAGPASSGYDAGERVVVPYLRRHGARRLEGLVLTHPDGDHTGGSAAVVRALHPRWVGDPGVPAGKGLYVDVLRATAASGVPWIGLARGATLDADGVRIQVEHPFEAGRAVEDANDASVVLRVSYGAFSALLTGDAPLSVEDALARAQPDDLASTVLKVGHHGSATATGETLLAAASPRLALLSVGRHNHYGHPAASVIRRLQQHGIRILRTDVDGSVVVSADRSGRIEVRRERGNP